MIPQGMEKIKIKKDIQSRPLQFFQRKHEGGRKQKPPSLLGPET